MKRFGFSLALLLCISFDVALAQVSTAGWIQQRSGTRFKLNDVVMLDSMTAIAVGQFGTILKTTNAGQMWRQIYWTPIIRPLFPWNAISFGSPTTGIVVGDGISSAITTNAGESWTLTGRYVPPTVVRRNFLSVAMLGTSRIFVGNDSGTVAFTTNGGTTWQTLQFGSEPISDIFFSTGPSVSGPVGYVLTPQRIYRTTNLGSTWRADTVQGPALSLRRGDISEDANAYAVGTLSGSMSPMIVYRNSADTAWRRWIFMPPLPSGWVSDASAPASRVAYACGTIPLRCAGCSDNGMFFKTMNGGLFWTGGFGFRRGLNAIDFFNERRGFIVGDSGAIFFTPIGGGGRVVHAFRLLSPRDGDTLLVGTTFRYQWQRAPDLEPDTAWYQLFISTNGPDGPWSSYQGGTVDTITAPLPAPPQGQYWWMVRAADGTNGATCEEVFSFVTRTTLSTKSSETPLEFALHQNYPNPFNPTTTIEYELLEKSFVRLSVFNLLGEEVATLVNEVQGAGLKSVAFDASKFSSGVYIYKLEAGGFASARKLVLMR